MATEVTLAPTDGTVTVLDLEETAQIAAVVITNRFDVGQLELSKTADRSTAIVGDVVRYTITLRNTGQIEATDITITDLLPDGATFVRRAGGPCRRQDLGVGRHVYRPPAKASR